jgi:type VI secretion system lysozyme-like protein
LAFFKKFTNNSREEQIDAYLSSIVDNLNNMLNTKKEYGSIVADLGIRDLNEFRSRENIAAKVVEEVRRNIEKYEPRVELKDIKPVKSDSPFVLSFKIECIVRKNDESLHLVFDTLFSKFLIEEIQ